MLIILIFEKPSKNLITNHQLKKKKNFFPSFVGI